MPKFTGSNHVCWSLKVELIALELVDVSLDENGYLMAKLPSNVDYDVPAIGFVAPWILCSSGANVKPQVIKDYQGGTIELGTSGECLNPKPVQRPWYPA